MFESWELAFPRHIVNACKSPLLWVTFLHTHTHSTRRTKHSVCLSCLSLPRLLFSCPAFSLTYRPSCPPRTLIERNPPFPGGVETPTPRGGFLFTMFPLHELCVRGPPSKDLYQVLRGGFSYTRFLMRKHLWNIINSKPPRREGFLSINSLCSLVLQGSVCCSMLPCVAVCCSVLQSCFTRLLSRLFCLEHPKDLRLDLQDPLPKHPPHPHRYTYICMYIHMYISLLHSLQSVRGFDPSLQKSLFCPCIHTSRRVWVAP